MVGNYCVFHGNNCIGNKGGNELPRIGNNVDFGFGSIVIGEIAVGDGSIIGAGSVVTNSFSENSIIVGIPGRAINRK